MTAMVHDAEQHRCMLLLWLFRPAGLTRAGADSKGRTLCALGLVVTPSGPHVHAVTCAASKSNMRVCLREGQSGHHFWTCARESKHNTPDTFRLSGTVSGTGHFCMTAAVGDTTKRPGVHHVGGPDSSCVVYAGFHEECSSTSKRHWAACRTTTHASSFDGTAPWRLQVLTMPYNASCSSMIPNVHFITCYSLRVPSYTSDQTTTSTVVVRHVANWRSHLYKQAALSTRSPRPSTTAHLFQCVLRAIPRSVAQAGSLVGRCTAAVSANPSSPAQP